MIYKILADLVAIIHMFWLGFALLGFLVSLCGFFQNRLFDLWLLRTLHFCAILCVVVTTFIMGHCPFTVWENALRARYDPSSAYQGSFIVHYAQKFINPDIKLYLIRTITTFIIVFSVAVFIIRPPDKIKRLFTLFIP